MEQVVAGILAALLLGIIITGFAIVSFESQFLLGKSSSLPLERRIKTPSPNISEVWDAGSSLPRAGLDRFLDSRLDEALCKGGGSEEIMIGVGDREGAYERVNDLLAEDDGKVINVISIKCQPEVVVANVPREVISSLRWRLLNEGIADYVEPNMRFKTTAMPNDPEWTLNWGLRKIESDYAWNTTVGQSSVVIAVVDTGVDWKHADLAGNIWNNTDEGLDGIDNDGNGFIDNVRGWDFVDTFAEVWPGEDGTVRDNDPMDFYGHGTHCAGIAAAVGNNALGISGVAWNCKIMPLRAGYKDSEGGGSLEIDDVAAAIIYAADNGADFYQGPFQNKTGADGIGDTPHIIDANNRDNYPLMKPLLMLGFEQKTLDVTDWDEWFNCTIKSPLLSSFGVNASISFGEETIHITPEGQVLGDRNNNNIPDLLLRFNRYEIVDFAMCQIAKNLNSFELFRGFALRITLTIAGRMGGVTFEVKDTITVVSPVSSTPI